MDKTVVLAVAGSGKTSHVVDRLDLTSRSIVLTYTENNFRNLKVKITQKFGHFPRNIFLNTYFRFLYAFCFSPFLARKTRAKGIRWDMPPQWTMRLPRDRREFFFDRGDRLYHNRIAKLLASEGVLELVNERIEKYSDGVFIDEIQDFAGHDFDLLCSIANAKVHLLFVGDFFQHTFDTSRDGNVNGGLHKDHDKYMTRLKQTGMTFDYGTLSKSYRCSPIVCRFISQHLGIPMESHRQDDTSVRLLTDQVDADCAFNCRTTVKLFYRQHYEYNCLSRNWGDCKGEDQYSDVCVVLNKTTWNKFQSNDLRSLSPQTRNKLYVACSRARGDLMFVPETLYERYARPG